MDGPGESNQGISGQQRGDSSRFGVLLKRHGVPADVPWEQRNGAPSRVGLFRTAALSPPSEGVKTSHILQVHHGREDEDWILDRFVANVLPAQRCAHRAVLTLERKTSQSRSVVLSCGSECCGLGSEIGARSLAGAA